MEPRKTRLLHWDGELPQLGQYLKTASGTHYMVLGFKPNTRPDAKSLGSMTILRLSQDEVMEIPSDAKIHGFQWIGGRKKRD